MAEFVMPSLGADMTSGTLAKWRVAPGDSVSQGDIIAEVETDKGTIEVEAFDSGVVRELRVREGQKVPVGTVLAEIGVAGTDADLATDTRASAGARTDADVGVVMSSRPSRADPGAPLASPAVRRRAHELDVSLRDLEGSGEHGRITFDDLAGAARGIGTRLRISPYARRLARERGVDVSELHGTGHGGAIQARDVLRAEVGSVVASASPAERMQRAIASAMTRANQEIPHYYVEHTIDMGTTLAWLKETNASRSVAERLVYGVVVLRAVARALRKHTQLNGTWKDDQVVLSEDVHVGLAVSLRGGGLVAPALRNTDQGTLSELMLRMTDLVSRARAGTLRSSEITSATITVTSLGERGVEGVTPIIFPPQVAIVGCGAILERPWIVDAEIVARPVMRVTLGADHRVSNGHQGARFLRAVDRLLQEPEAL